MAKREVFIFYKNKVIKKEFDFLWEGDSSLRGNRKKIKNLHAVIKDAGFGEALEISYNAEGDMARRLMESNFWRADELCARSHYDYLVISEVVKEPELIEYVKKFNVFTDLAYHHDKRRNTVARSLVILRYLLENDLLEKYLKKPNLKKFIKLYDNL